jgi:hypothetical protein
MLENLALIVAIPALQGKYRGIFTMGPGNLAPDHTDLGATDLLLSPVDIGNLLAKVEARITVSNGFLMLSRCVLGETYLAAGVSSTPSILMRLVLEWVVWRPRW